MSLSRRASLALPSSSKSMHVSSFTLPDLVSHCTFPLTYHPAGDAVAKDSLAWLLSFTGHLSARKRGKMAHLLAGELTAYCYPNCPAFELRVVSDFMNYLFHLDDVSDGLIARDAGGLGRRVMHALEHPDAYVPLEGLEGEEEIGAARIARDFWSRCIRDARPGVQARFKESMRLFFDAVERQARDRAAGDVPDLESYIEVRRDTSGCKPVFDLIEYSLGFELPAEVITHPVVVALNQGANDLVTWSNDIFSYNKEQARDDTHNMVAIFMQHDGLSLQEAIDRVGELCKDTIDGFVENQARLPSWGPEVDAMVQGYVRGLQDWIVGSLHWSFMTTRYFGDAGAEVKKGRTVAVAELELTALRRVWLAAVGVTRTKRTGFYRIFFPF
ncbi:hypothetical protein EWM64_g9415 [Hericium alpestre]|uniref:Terpene synthase n=1 Tax=Hericium alpestre TaxID=135208 RepID=A0A4Y9ZIK3_9AGAM|nr:hypothetical protein EWM64_g9415 [Hericium alpestre]